MILAFQADAQRNYRFWDGKAANFGFFVGFNSSTFYPIESPAFEANDSLLTALSQTVPGIQFGFILPNLKLNEHLALRFLPGMMFAGRHIDYRFDNIREDRLKRSNSVYIDFPLNLKLRSDLINNSYRAYVVAGGKYSLDFASKAKVVEDFERIKIIKPDYSWELGIGFEMYFPYFKLSPELKLATGLSNVLVPEAHQFAGAFEQLRTRTWMLSFHFE